MGAGAIGWWKLFGCDSLERVKEGLQALLEIRKEMAYVAEGFLDNTAEGFVPVGLAWVKQQVGKKANLLGIDVEYQGVGGSSVFWGIVSFLCFGGRVLSNTWPESEEQ